MYFFQLRGTEGSWGIRDRFNDICVAIASTCVLHLLFQATTPFKIYFLLLLWT